MNLNIGTKDLDHTFLAERTVDLGIAPSIRLSNRTTRNGGNSFCPKMLCIIFTEPENYPVTSVSREI